MEAGTQGSATRVFISIRRNAVESNADGLASGAAGLEHQAELGQRDFYAAVVHPFVERCLQGCCGSIITYGGWGSGKSYTLGTLDPQQLAVASSGDTSAGVLPRCLRQLYERLGPNAAVEITCVEVQGEEVADLLDPRVEPPAGRLVLEGPTLGGAAAAAPGVGGSSVSPLTPRSMARSPRPVMATRRKPLTLAVARSLPEALLTVQRAVSCRQAFVTATRHSSSRTHAVFQLRWRNPTATSAATVGPRSSGLAASSATEAVSARQGYTVTTSARRPFSAPARGGFRGPAASAAASSGGSVCTLTLVDTCSSCPLLAPKEGSAVKRSLLALGRVLSALQRRQAPMLRESKLTRLLEGALDQVLLVACFGGSTDETALQMVKQLQQGAPRDGVQRRMRRASSFDSRRQSAAWDSPALAAGHPGASASPCSVVSVTLGPAAALPATARPCRPAAPAAACTPLSSAGCRNGVWPGVPTSAAQGRRGKLPATRASMPAGVVAPAVAAFPQVATVAASVSGRHAASSAVESPAGGVAGRNRVGPAPLDAQHQAADGACGFIASTPPAAPVRVFGGASSPSPLPQPQSGACAVASAASPVSRISASPGVLRPGVGSTRGPNPNRSLSPTTFGYASVSPAHKSSSAAASGYAGGGAVGVGSSTPGAGLQARAAVFGALVSSATRTRRCSGEPGVSASQQPMPTMAHGGAGAEARRSQGCSVRKWGPSPPPTSHKLDKPLPVLPVVLSPDAGSASPGRTAGPAPGPASAPPSSRARPAQSASQRAASPLAGTPRPTAAPLGVPSSADVPGGGREPVSSGAYVAASPASHADLYSLAATPVTGPSATVHISTAASGVSACISPASGSLSQRRVSGIPTAPTARGGQAATSPFLSVALASAAATGAATSSPMQRARSPIPCSPPVALPAATSPTVSLAAMHSAPRASTRYSCTSAPYVAVAPTSSAFAAATAPTGTRLGRDEASTGRNGSVASLGYIAGRAAVSPARAQAPALDAVDELTAAAASGRWPSPMLRMRRAERLAVGRRSRSALPRPRPLAALEAEARGTLARAASARAASVCRAAPLPRVTLSAQYQDLVHDFQAFQASFRHRTPIHQRSAASDAANGNPAPATRPSQPGHAARSEPHLQPSQSAVPACAHSRSRPRLLQLPVPARALGSSLGSPAPSVTDNRQLSPSPGRYSQHEASPLRGYRHASGQQGQTSGLPAVQESPPRPSNLGRAQSAAPSSLATSSLLGSVAAAKSLLPRHRSPAAEDGLMSLTAAAAAAAAASPRPAASTGQPLSGRQRPGVSRSSGAQPSPCRPRRSLPCLDSPRPDIVLDMNRLHSATALGNNPSPPRAAATAASATSPALTVATGADAGAAFNAGAGSSAGAQPPAVEAGAEGECMRSTDSLDSGLGNMLGPNSLADLHLMLTPGGAAALGCAGGAASPRAAGSGAAGAAPGAPSGSPSDYKAAAAAPSGSPRKAPGRKADDRLPAYSCFVIPQHALAASPAPTSGHGPGGDASGAVPKAQGSPTRTAPQQQGQLQRQQQSAAASIAGALHAVPLLQLAGGGAPGDRLSVESGVLRASCTASAVDDMSPRGPVVEAQRQFQDQQQAAGQHQGAVAPQLQEQRHRLARCGEARDGCGSAAAPARALARGQQEPQGPGSGGSSQAEQLSATVCAEGSVAPASRSLPPAPTAATAAPRMFDQDEPCVILGDTDSDADVQPAASRNRAQQASTGAAGSPGPVASHAAAKALTPGRMSVRDRVAAFEAASTPPSPPRAGWTLTQCEGLDGTPETDDAMYDGRSSWSDGDDSADFPKPEPSEEPVLHGKGDAGHELDSARALTPPPVRDRPFTGRAPAGMWADGRRGAKQQPAHRPQPQQQRRGQSPTYAAAAAAAAARATASPASPSARGYGFGAAGRFGGDAVVTATLVPKGQPTPKSSSKPTVPSPVLSRRLTSERPTQPAPRPFAPTGASPRTFTPVAASARPFVPTGASPRTFVPPAAATPSAKSTYTAQAAQRVAQARLSPPAAPKAAAGTAISTPVASPVLPARSKELVGSAAKGSGPGTQEHVRAAQVGGQQIEAEEAELGPPPPAYPSGFVRWAKRVFSNGAGPTAAR